MEPIPPLRSSKVLIVGKGPGWDKALEFLNTDWNIWTIPQGYTLINSHRVDLVFELHSPEQWKRKKGRLYELNRLFTSPKLIVPTRVHGWTNNSYVLPTEELKRLGVPLINSFGWMIAYAIHRGATEIAFRGINLDWAHEAETERDGMMFLLGYLRASDIKINVDVQSGLAKGHSIRL